MTHETTIRAIDGSAGVEIPREMLERLRLSEGDRAQLIETDEGIFLLPFDETVADAAKAYSRTKQKYPNALRDLAK
jgi:putative addiction module antidote